MTPEQELTRASRAKEVLENEVYIEAFERIKQEIVEQWANAPARDTEGREHLWLQQKLLDKLQITLQSVMEGGKVARAELLHKQTIAERLTAWKR